MFYNVSGPVSSDVFAIQPGSMYLLSFASSWRGNWTGSFTASVSLFQYRSADEATADENPSQPLYPSTVNFIPCKGGDARHCTVWHESTGIPRLPNWGRFSTNFMTMPSARFLRVRSFISGWGTGQWWLDDVKITRVDGELKNVIVTPDAAVNVTSSDCGETRKCVRGRDFTFKPHEGTGRRSRGSVLPGSGLGNDTTLSHMACQQHLAQDVVDFMCTSMSQILALQINPCATQVIRHSRRQREGRRPPRVMGEQVIQFMLKLFGACDCPIILL